MLLFKSFGGLAQLVRASASHAEGRRFEPATLHQNKNTGQSKNDCPVLLCLLFEQWRYRVYNNRFFC